jgi:AbrB family looped-hinge helix DNA binding protein
VKGIAVARMSSKGQVVIPIQVRQSLGLDAGSRFVVTAEDDVIVQRLIGAPAKKDYSPLLRLVGRLT